MTDQPVSLLFLLVAAFIVLTVAAVTDVRSRRIPNILVLILLALWLASRPLVVMTSGWSVALADPLICAALALVLGFVLFAFRLFGAGDAKLFAVMMLYAGSGHAISYVLVTAMTGGILALAFIMHAIFTSPALPEGHGSQKSSTPSLPYGIALWAGGSWILIQQILS